MIVIAGDKKQDDIFHKLGVFESFKVLAHIHQLEIDVIKGAGDLTRQHCQNVYNEFIASDDLRPVAVFVPGRPDTVVKDETVKVVSDGFKFVMLDDVFKSYGALETKEKT